MTNAMHTAFWHITGAEYDLNIHQNQIELHINTDPFFAPIDTRPYSYS